MKASYTIFSLLLSLFLLYSCNDTPKEEKSIPTAEKVETKKPPPSVLYVIAPSGLILRQQAALDSKRIGKMPYGSTVNVVSPDSTGNTLEVANIPGSMLRVNYKDTTGFAYSGFLTQFSAPKNGEHANQYAQRLKTDFPSVIFETKKGGTADHAQTKLILTLPARSWSEAFLIAKQLFKLPAEFNFPRLSGPAESTVKGRPTGNNITSISLTAKRTGNSLSGINYTESAKTFERLVEITKKDGVFELMEQVTEN